MTLLKNFILVATLAFSMAVSSVYAGTLTVDLSAPIKPVDHAASGSLYGIADVNWPPERWIEAVQPKNFTQMAPGGQHLPNGETAPVGDALKVAPIAARYGASVTIRMPDIFPSFPYVWKGDEFWADEIDRVVTETVAANLDNIYGYEIWNEPDWNWNAEWGDFNQLWATTYTRIRAIDADRAIMGPSATKWDRDWIRAFLVSAVETASVPEIISWHELDPMSVSDIEVHVAEYRALEKELGLSARPISINEYGSPRTMADPGALTHYIAQLERAGVDTANLAFWHRPGRLSDLLAPVEGGRGPAINVEPTGAFWLYDWYGEMSGNMVAASAVGGEKSPFDGFAAFDSTKRIASIVVGGEAGDHSIVVSGLEQLGDVVDIKAQATHWTGTDGGLAAPTDLFSGRFAVVEGVISVPVQLQRGSDAINLVITPGTGVAPSSGVDILMVPQNFSARFEAEDGERVRMRKFVNRLSPRKFFANKFSGESFVGFLNRSEASLTFTITVPQAGTYDLSFGYSNGLDSVGKYGLSINGVSQGMVEFTPTQARELIDQVHVRAELPEGESRIVLTSGPVVEEFLIVPSVLELDYLDVSAVSDN